MGEFDGGRRLVAGLGALALAVGLVACDSTSPAAPGDGGNGGDDGSGEEPVVQELTVDASEGWAFVDLADDLTTVPVSEPGSSDAWDAGVFATSVMLNGGDAGPGGVVGHCLCQNEGATDQEVMEMTSEGDLEAFEAVTAEDVPSEEDAWVADTLVAAVDGWYSYDPQSHVVSADPSAVWKVRTADGSSYAKVHVVSIESPTQEHAGTVALEFAVQEEAGAGMGPDQELSVDLAAEGTARIDLESGTVTEDAGAWDLSLSGYTIRVNGGVSGDGNAGALRVEESYADVSDASDLSARHYQADTYGGVFSASDGRSWYRYNLDGQHQIWPTYNVYLVRSGNAVYKAQLTGYYDETGESRQVTLRVAPLGG